MDRGLVTFPHVGGFSSGLQDPDVTGSKPVPEKSPADQGQETGTGLTGLRRAGPEPANRSAAPPAKRRIFPDTLFLPVLLWFRGRLAVRGWFGRTPSRDSLPFSGPYGHPP